MKKNLTLTIDEELLSQANKHIPNLSAFFEECLKKQLGYGDQAIFPVHKAQEEIDIIGNSMLNLHIMTEKEKYSEIAQEFEDHKHDQIWRKLYHEYKYGGIDLSPIDEASPLLGVTTNELVDVLYVAYNYIPKEEATKCNSWKYCYNKYKEYIEGEK